VKLGPEPNTYNGCFGCGPVNPVGLKLEFHRDGDIVVSRTVLASEYAGYRQFCHGGVVATLLDEAMGWALFHIGGHYGVTQELSVQYRRPVYVQRPIVLRARIVEANGKSSRLESTIEDERGRLLARATGDWVIVRRERASDGPI
jgi:uncharacterized protein (TIGR00369 family)